MDHEGIVIKRRSLMAAVRTYPDMYFGKPREHPELPGGVVWWVVEDALTEQATQVYVTVETDRQFTVTDNGPGLRLAALPDMFIKLISVKQSPRGLNLAIATALCSTVIAETWTDGQHYRLHIQAGYPEPIAHLGPTDKTGTRLTYQLDDEYFDNAAIPANIPSLLANLATGSSHLEIVDLRQP